MKRIIRFPFCTFAAIRTLVYVPRGYAHRTINSGDDPLIVFFAFDADAGHDYGTIETRGYRHLILKGNDGEDQIVPNPRWN